MTDSLDQPNPHHMLNLQAILDAVRTPSAEFYGLRPSTPRSPRHHGNGLDQVDRAT
jgi:hypothetical protein